MTAAKKAEAKSNFSADFKELEEIVRWFESNEVDLEEGLKKFEHGLELAKKCRARIKEVENKVTLIKAKFEAVAEGEDVDEEPDEKQPSLL
jgi:exodeoxyribonuclease VII small subunit